MRALVRTVLAVLVLTALVGFAYPLVVTGFGQVAFRGKADGSLVEVDGRIVGSRLVAQGFQAARYFHPRPSATSPPYNGAGTTFANLGPTNPTLAHDVATRAQAILRLEGPYNRGLTLGDIPVDAVTTSGSGIDPHVSPAYAELQARRVAAVRHLSLARIHQLIEQATQGRSLGFFGEPAVNVLTLNLALDRESG